jgi:hypothetical protein
VRNVLFTDGAKHVAGTGCPTLRTEDCSRRVQPWELTVDLVRKSNSSAVFTKMIDFPDFPVEEVRLYFCNNTILLPSEY